MLQQTTKTPAMVLQEFAVKNGYQTPEYILVRSKTGTHETEFHYKVTIADISGIGFGRSKQVAKHAAASKALEILKEKGLYDPNSNPISEFNPQQHRNESDSPMKPQINFIGRLQDLCAENKLPMPVFSEISDVGPAHCRSFTYECRIGSIITQSTANTKKQAKQLAAKEMLEKINDIYPHLIEQYTAANNALLSKDQDAIARYNEIQNQLGIIPNKAINVCEFTKTLYNIMISKSLKFDDLRDLFNDKNEDNLQQILNLLDVKYSIEYIQENPFIVLITLGIETPFAVMGVGLSRENAFNKAIEDCLNFLKIYLDHR